MAAQDQEGAPDTPSNPRRLTTDPCNKVDLCRFVVFQRRQRVDVAKPIVSIGSEMRNSSHRSYAVPVFTITGWIDANEVSEPPPSQLSRDLSEHPQANGTIPGDATTTAPLPQPRRRKKKPEPAPWEDADDLNDEIPY